MLLAAVCISTLIAGIPADRVTIAGDTGIDALLWAVAQPPNTDTMALLESFDVVSGPSGSAGRVTLQQASRCLLSYCREGDHGCTLSPLPFSVIARPKVIPLKAHSLLSFASDLPWVLTDRVGATSRPPPTPTSPRTRMCRRSASLF